MHSPIVLQILLPMAFHSHVCYELLKKSVEIVYLLMILKIISFMCHIIGKLKYIYTCCNCLGLSSEIPLLMQVGHE